ncbi:ParB/RepB/Spo0J family partition protein [Novosphingobium sp. NPDC080210]|uniref:ParB/RepB/Spo0J family partition protein n=1 Tax=Novosphingobium sp. NPDC080210 TaxID=3390596 RepID=UPI003CFD7895
MKFEELDPRSIEPSPWNANVVSHENEEKLRASIERHGMFKPILVRVLDNGAIQCIGGWHRCEQAIELGYAKVPVVNLGAIDDERAKEISLADNARYGIDDTLKLSGLLEDLDASVVASIMPWTHRDIEALTASIAVNIDDLDLDPNIDLTGGDEDDEREAPAPKAPKTHQLLKFRVPIGDAQRISALIAETMREEGFTAADDMSNAGEALAYLLLNESEDADAVS